MHSPLAELFPLRLVYRPFSFENSKTLAIRCHPPGAHSPIVFAWSFLRSLPSPNHQSLISVHQPNLSNQYAHLTILIIPYFYGRTAVVPPPSLCLFLKNTNYALDRNRKPIR